MTVYSGDRIESEHCWFCETAPAHEASAAIVEMHAGGFLGDGKKYQVIDSDTLFVPRCQRCKSVHDRVEGYVVRGWLIGLFIGVVVVLYEVGFAAVTDYWKLSLIVVIAFGMAGGVVAWLFGRFLLPKGVKDQRAR